MNKTQIEHLSTRINNVARCICGKVIEECRKKTKVAFAEYADITLEEANNVISHNKLDLIKFTLLMYSKGDMSYFGEVDPAHLSEHDFLGKGKKTLKVEKEYARLYSKFDTQSTERCEVVHLQAKKLIDEFVFCRRDVKEITWALDAFAKESF